LFKIVSLLPDLMEPFLDPAPAAVIAGVGIDGVGRFEAGTPPKSGAGAMAGRKTASERLSGRRFFCWSTSETAVKSPIGFANPQKICLFHP